MSDVSNYSQTTNILECEDKNSLAKNSSNQLGYVSLSEFFNISYMLLKALCQI